MDESAISWSDAPFDSQNQLFPTSVFPAETLDPLDTNTNTDNLTYATLESVKPIPAESLCIAATTSAANSTSSSAVRQEVVKREQPVEQPIDLTLGRQNNFTDINPFNYPVQVNITLMLITAC